MTTCEFCGQAVLDGEECHCAGAVEQRKVQKKDR